MTNYRDFSDENPPRRNIPGKDFFGKDFLVRTFLEKIRQDHVFDFGKPNQGQKAWGEPSDRY